MKKIILSLAAVALMASCSKNEVTEINPSAPGLIGLSPTTSRAAITTIADAGFLSGGAGFSVWATSTGVDGWYQNIEGMSHVNASGIWNFTPAPIAWPTTAANYPMRFYSIYPNVSVPAALAGYTDASSAGTAGGNDQSVSFSYVVRDTKLTQVDLLGASSTANVKPAASNLAVTFAHLLSKITFGVDVASDMALRIQGLTVNFVGNTGTYTFTQAPAAPAVATTPGSWTTAPTTYASNYLYYGVIHDTPSGYTTGDDYIVVGERSITGGKHNDLFEDTDSMNLKNLMLMPQAPVGGRILTTTDGKLTALPDGSQSYVTMIYRLNQNSTRLVGYNAAQDHPGYNSANPSANGIGSSHTFLSPLYVKVVFPFTLSWAPGKGYHYMIPFNAEDATGGYLIDQYYYDDAGNRTNLVVGDVDGDGDAEAPLVKDPVLISDGDIHLIPTITDWDDTPADIVINN